MVGNVFLVVTQKFLESLGWVPAHTDSMLQTQVIQIFHEWLFRPPEVLFACSWLSVPLDSVASPTKTVEVLGRQSSSLLHCSCWPLLATFFFFCKVSMVLSLPTVALAICWKLLFQRGFFWQHGDLYANKRIACSFRLEKGLLSHSLFTLKKYQVHNNDFHEEGSAKSA